MLVIDAHMHSVLNNARGSETRSVELDQHHVVLDKVVLVGFPQPRWIQHLAADQLGDRSRYVHRNVIGKGGRTAIQGAMRRTDGEKALTALLGVPDEGPRRARAFQPDLCRRTSEHRFASPSQLCGIVQHNGDISRHVDLQRVEPGLHLRFEAQELAFGCRVGLQRVERALHRHEGRPWLQDSRVRSVSTRVAADAFLRCENLIWFQGNGAP